VKTDQKLDAQIRRSSKLLAELFHLAATDSAVHNNLLVSLRRAVNPSVQEELAWLFQAAQSRLYKIGDDLQIIVDQQRKPDPPAGLSRKFHKRLVVFWNERFPGKGELLMSEGLLAPFYSNKLSFHLKPPATDLEDQCHKSVFWTNFNGVKITTSGDVSEVSLQTSLSASLWNSLQASLPASLGSTLRASLWARPGAVLGNSQVSLGDSLWNALLASLYQISTTGNGLGDSLVYACGFALAEDRGKDFGPLLRLWRSGNLPLGFDTNGNLLVLCASAQNG